MSNMEGVLQSITYLPTTEYHCGAMHLWSQPQLLPCDTWVHGYGGGGKDIVKSGSIGLYSQRNNLRFVVLGCFVSVVSEDGE